MGGGAADPEEAAIMNPEPQVATAPPQPDLQEPMPTSNTGNKDIDAQMTGVEGMEAPPPTPPSPFQNLKDYFKSIGQG